MANLTLTSGTPNTSSTITGFNIKINFTYSATAVPGQTKISWEGRTAYTHNSSYPASNTRALAEYILNFTATTGTIIEGNTYISYNSGSNPYPTFKTSNNTSYNQLIGSGYIVVQHNYLGNAAVNVSSSFEIGGWPCGSRSATLSPANNMPESVTITHGTAFNDTDKIAITYSNSVGADLTGIQVGLRAADRSDIISLLNAVTKPSGSNITSGTYNFDISSGLTKLYSLMPTSNSINVYLTIARNYSDGTTYTTNTPITITLVNTTPTLSLTIIDSNSTTTALTGNTSKFILGYSNAKVTFTYSLKKSATLGSLQLTNSAQAVLLTANGTINKINDANLKATVIDSRGNYIEVSKTLSTINYVKPSSVITSVEMTNDTTLKVNVKTSGFYSSFGSKTNSFTIKYRYKLEDGSYSSWASSGVSNKTATAEFTSSFNITTSNARLNHYIQV